MMYASVRSLVIGTSLAVGIVAASLLALAVFREDLFEVFTAGKEPRLLFDPSDAEQVELLRRTFGVAHNSGDSLVATRRALRAGADVIEVDVVSLRGELYAGHDPPLPLVGPRVFRGPRLEEVWVVARAADYVKLDLKESSPPYLRAVASFLNREKAERVIVSSRDLASLEFLARELPQAILLLSVPSASRLAALRTDTRALEVIDGVTLRHTLLDEESARWFEERGLLVFVWTVNDFARVAELARQGVDGVTTDNLAILTFLGANRPDERVLVSRRVAGATGDEFEGRSLRPRTRARRRAGGPRRGASPFSRR